MDFSSGYETHKDKIISTLKDLKEEGIMNQDQLRENLRKVYDKILPPMAKIFVKADAFVEACMKKKDELLKEVNRQERLARFTLIK